MVTVRRFVLLFLCVGLAMASGMSKGMLKKYKPSKTTVLFEFCGPLGLLSFAVAAEEYYRLRKKIWHQCGLSNELGKVETMPKGAKRRLNRNFSKTAKKEREYQEWLIGQRINKLHKQQTSRLNFFIDTGIKLFGVFLAYNGYRLGHYCLKKTSWWSTFSSKLGSFFTKNAVVAPDTNS